jgi:hypothetical protein
MKKDMVEYCNALKETARQKESDSLDRLDKRQLMNKIRHLEAENYILKQKLSQDDWK